MPPSFSRNISGSRATRSCRATASRPKLSPICRALFPRPQREPRPLRGAAPPARRLWPTRMRIRRRARPPSTIPATATEDRHDDRRDERDERDERDDRGDRNGEFAADAARPRTTAASANERPDALDARPSAIERPRRATSRSAPARRRPRPRDEDEDAPLPSVRVMREERNGRSASGAAAPRVAEPRRDLAAADEDRSRQRRIDALFVRQSAARHLDRERPTAAGPDQATPRSARPPLRRPPRRRTRQYRRLAA